MSQDNFYKTGRVEDYLSMKEENKRRTENVTDNKDQGSYNKTGQLRGV